MKKTRVGPKVSPIEKIAADVQNNTLGQDDVVMLRLDSLDHNPVGYIWFVKPKNFTLEWDKIKELKIYPTSGMATPRENSVFKKICSRAVDISKGDYLGYPILGYEILRKGKKEC